MRDRPGIIARLAAEAAEAADDPCTLGWALARYQHAQQLDDTSLAAQLGVAPAELDQLRLCPLPMPDPYLIKLTRIAEAFHLDAQFIALLLDMA